MSYRRKAAERLLSQGGSCEDMGCYKKGTDASRSKDRCPCCSAGNYCRVGTNDSEAVRIAKKWLETHPKKASKGPEHAQEETIDKE